MLNNEKKEERIMKRIIEGGVTAPKGFQAVGIAAGIKRKKKDMALIYSEVPCAAAGRCV